MDKGDGELCVIEYYGLGGVGKSSLLKELEEDIKNGSKEHDKAKVIRYDFADSIDGVTVIEDLSRKLKNDYKFEFFRLNKGLAAYKDFIGESVEKYKQKSIFDNKPKLGDLAKVASIGLLDLADVTFTIFYL